MELIGLMKPNSNLPSFEVMVSFPEMDWPAEMIFSLVERRVLKDNKRRSRTCRMSIVTNDTRDRE